MSVDKIAENLERKFNWLKVQPANVFIFELKNYIEYLANNPLIKRILNTLIRQLEEKDSEYHNKLKIEEKEAVRLKNKFRKKFPELDDSKQKKKPDAFHDSEYENSFAFLNELAKDEYEENSIPMMPDIADDNSKVNKMIGILRNKLFYRDVDENGGVGEEKCRDDELWLELVNLIHQHETTEREWYIFKYSHPAVSWWNLADIYNSLIPEPIKYLDREDWRKKNLSFAAFKRAHYSFDPNDLLYAQSSYSSKRGNDFSEQKINAKKDKVLKHVKTLYEYLRIEINEELNRDEVMIRFKQKVERFQKDEYRAEFEVGGNENSFTLKNAEFLFDNNISTAYRLHRGTSEYDLVQDENSENPLFIESKLYGKTQNVTKKTVIGWYKQAIWYVSEKNIPTKIIYLVTYHVGNKLLNLPSEITLGDYTIKHIGISIASSEEAGQRTKGVITLTLKEIEEGIKK